MSSFTLRAERLELRAPQAADVAAYERHFVDYEVIRCLSAAVPWPYPEGGIEDYFRERILPLQGKDRWFWGLFLHTAPYELIGMVELWRPGSPENRGFWLGRRYWGLGLMTEAVGPILDAAFDQLGFESLVFSNAVGNHRSRRVKEKTGAVFLRSEPAEFVDPALTARELWRLDKMQWQAWRQKQAARRLPVEY